MKLTEAQTLIIIFAVAAGTMLTRFLPFIMFPENKKPPEIIHYLGKVLPPAMMGLLVVYCLKNVSILKSPHAIPEIIATVLIVFLHKWKNNVLISIGAGTIAYMFLVQVVF